MLILVVVAFTQVRSLRADEGKGSVRTSIGHGSVGPEPQGSSERRREGREALRLPAGEREQGKHPLTEHTGRAREGPWRRREGAGRLPERTREELSFLSDWEGQHGARLALRYAPRPRLGRATSARSGAPLLHLENPGTECLVLNRTHNRIRSPRLAASGHWKNVGKGSRQNCAVT